MGAQHYTDPFCSALRDNDYEKAKHILETHISTKEPFTSSQSYFGLTSECKDTDLLWKVITHFSLFIKGHGSEKPTFYRFLRDLEGLKGSSRRIRFLLNKVIEKNPDTPKELMNHMLPFFYSNDYSVKRAELVNKNIVLRLISLGANPNVQVDKYRHQGRNMIEKIVNNKDFEMFDVVATKDINYIFGNVEDIDIINILAELGLLEAWLEKHVNNMTFEQRTTYQSYLLLDLIKSNNNEL